MLYRDADLAVERSREGEPDDAHEDETDQRADDEDRVFETISADVIHAERLIVGRRPIPEDGNAFAVDRARVGHPDALDLAAD